MSTKTDDLPNFIELPPIFRPIGPSDDVVVSSEKMLEWVKHQQLSLIDRIPKPIESPSDIRCGNSRPLKEREIVMKSYNKCLKDVEAALRKELE